VSIFIIILYLCLTIGRYAQIRTVVCTKNGQFLLILHLHCVKYIGNAAVQRYHTYIDRIRKMTTMVVNAFNWDGFSSWFKNYRQKLAQKRTYRNTLKELSQLSDRELCDIGINRGMIHSVAMETYFDNRGTA